MSFKSEPLFKQIQEGLEGMGADEKKKQMKQVNGIFEMRLKNGLAAVLYLSRTIGEGKEKVWTIDLKKEGKVYEGNAKPKADVTINMADDTFQDLADGKIGGQKAFMSGKLKVKGNIMLATKLDQVLKSAQSKL